MGEVDEAACKIRRVKATAIYSMSQTVRITRKNMQFENGFELKWTFELFRISKLFRRSPLPLYDLDNLRYDSFNDQFYVEELVQVKGTMRTEYLKLKC